MATNRAASVSTIPEIKTILYATDLGTHMRPVFRFAVSLAQRYQARIIMLHVLEPLGATGHAVVDMYLSKQQAQKLEQDGLKKILKLMKKRVERFYAEEMSDSPDHTELVDEVVVVEGRPSEEISRQADRFDADLIVVGTGTTPGLLHGMLGSTAHAIRSMYETASTG